MRNGLDIEFVGYECRPQKQTLFSRWGAYNPSKEDENYLRLLLRKEYRDPPLSGAVEVHLTFNLRKPKRGKVTHHTKRPDIDNLAYLVTNAMKDLVYEDDSQIVKMTLEKFYAEIPSLRIVVKELTADSYGPVI